MLAANYRWLLDQFGNLQQSKGQSLIGLDFGCGDGTTVATARQRGWQFWGAETYFDRAEYRERRLRATPPAAVPYIREIPADGKLPFEDNTFDFVCSYQVIEHIDDLGAVSSELARVTKADGCQIHVFPTLEIIREPHLGVPLVHRLPDGAFRNMILWMWHRLALTKHGSGIEFAVWKRDSLSYMESSVRYRSLKQVIAILGDHFDVEVIEHARFSSCLQTYGGRRSVIARGVERLPARLVHAVQLRRGGTTLRLRKRVH